MHTGITGTTCTFFGRPYTAYPTETPPPTLNTSITFNNKIATIPKHIANCFTKKFTKTVKHATHKTNSSIKRATQNIQGYNITLNTTLVHEAIKQSKNNNSQGPDKHRPSWARILYEHVETALNTNIIPHICKLASIVSILKPIIIIIAVGCMRQRLPSFSVLLYGVSPYISL